MRHDDIFEQAKELIFLNEKKDNLANQVNMARKDLRQRSSENPVLTETLMKEGKLHPDFLNDLDDVVTSTYPLIESLKILTRVKPSAFYFGNAFEYDENLAKTGQEFATNNLLSPPFSHFIFFADNLPLLNGLKNDFLWGEWNEEERIVSILVQSKDLDDRECKILEINFAERKSSLITQDKTPLTVKDTNDFTRTTLSFFQMLIMLNHPFYEREHVEAPPKVNKKREESGKSKLTDYITIKLNAKVKAALGTDGSGSPRRPHWRRGHIRRLSTGAIVPVRPCMVNWRGEAIEPKEYRISA